MIDQAKSTSVQLRLNFWTNIFKHENLIERIISRTFILSRMDKTKVNDLQNVHRNLTVQTGHL